MTHLLAYPLVLFMMLLGALTAVGVVAAVSAIVGAVARQPQTSSKVEEAVVFALGVLLSAPVAAQGLVMAPTLALYLTSVAASLMAVSILGAAHRWYAMLLLRWMLRGQTGVIGTAQGPFTGDMREIARGTERN